MLPTRCQEYLRVLRRYFPWLFDEFQFVVLQVENGYMDSCSFLLQGGNCRLFFGIDRGRLGLVQIAMVPRSNCGTLDLPDLQWYALLDVINYLLGRFPDQQEVLQQVMDTRMLEEDFAELSAKCRPLWPNVMTLFSEECFETEKVKLEAAIRKGRARLRRSE